MIGQLGLQKISTIHGRAEDFARKEEYREKFDLVVSRAVANLSSLSEYCLPYVKQQGIFVSYKASDVEEEVREAKKAVTVLGGNLEKTVEFQLPDTDIDRTLLVIQKIKKTPGKYPRKAGLPSKEPIR